MRILRVAMRAVQVIYGIDFSGAKDAGDKIWIARGVPEGGKLFVSECCKAGDLSNSGSRLEDCLPALVNLINSNGNAAFGFDFPFGVPAPMITAKTWEEFVLAFPEKYKSPEEFRESCRQAETGRELKRRTDRENHTPFSPYNLRLFRQTYYGISDVLLPLVRDGGACILPFQEAVAGKPWILEICPASSLKRLMEKRVPPYKGRKGSCRENRSQILADVMKAGVILGQTAEIKDKIIADKGGDALDSIIAAMATFNAIRNTDSLFPNDNGYWKIEGYVYV